MCELVLVFNCFLILNNICPNFFIYMHYMS